MDIRSQFAGRYKKDLSVDNLRTKVARRKSITQKENRHKEFRRSRGLSLVDANISVVKEQNLTVLEEVNESCHVTGHENKPADTTKTKAQVKNERHAMLQRFKEDKQLRKLKAQREKASKGVFKCGIYKAETSFIPVFAPLNAAKVKQKEKPAAPIVTRVTRSAAKTEPPLPKTRTQPVPVAVLNSKVSADRAIPRGRGQNSTVKKNEKENKVSTIPPARSTRATAAIASKLPTAVKGPLKSTAAAAKPHKKIVKEVKQQEMVIDKTEPPVIDQSNNKELEQEVAIKDTAVESETLAETSVLVQERKPSFAPQNFVFQPLDGLSSFKFQPMTPKRANAFLTPTFTWSPVEGKRNFVVTRGHHTQENDIDQVSPTEPSLKATIVKLDMDLITSPQIAECTSHASSPVPAGATVIPPSCEASTEKCNQSAQPEESQHDVPFFRGMLKSEIQSLSLMCRDWDQRIDMAIPEDAKDLIRTTVGQTRLLITERFKQFEGLVDNCEFKRGEKETMCTDLDGFWDMIYFQIEDVSKKFVNLRKLEENSWQQTTIQAKKVVRKKSAPTVTVKQNLGDNGRAAAKNRLAAIKAALKNNSKTEESVSEVSTPGLPMQVDPVVFDAGFFRIESPAKLPGSLRKKPSSSQTSNTPKSTTKVLQNSEIPVTKGVEEAVEDSQAQKSPSPVNSPVRKVLFAGAVEESLQNQETDPVVTYPDGTESDTVPQVVDLTQYLVPDETIRVGQEESPGLMECLGLESSLNTTDDYYKEANVENTSVMVDDVFMCSPEKVVHRTKSNSPLVDRPGLVPDEEVQTSDNPLDFLGSCTPIMVEK